MKSANSISTISRWDAHHRFAAALIAAGAVMLFTAGVYHPVARMTLAWIAYAGTMLALSWNTIVHADVPWIKAVAARQDTGRTVIFVVVLIGVGCSLMAIVFLTGKGQGLTPERALAHGGMAIVSIMASWLLTHTVFAFRYAHSYYAGGEKGLNFSHTKEPDYLDFIYFSYVIGMTSQVSDVTISSRGIRHIVLFHSILSFFFNTTIFALVVNLIAGFV